MVFNAASLGLETEPEPVTILPEDTLVVSVEVKLQGIPSWVSVGLTRKELDMILNHSVILIPGMFGTLMIERIRAFEYSNEDTTVYAEFITLEKRWEFL